MPLEVRITTERKATLARTDNSLGINIPGLGLWTPQIQRLVPVNLILMAS